MWHHNDAVDPGLGTYRSDMEYQKAGHPSRTLFHYPAWQCASRDSTRFVRHYDLLRHNSGFGNMLTRRALLRSAPSTLTIPIAKRMKAASADSDIDVNADRNEQAHIRQLFEDALNAPTVEQEADLWSHIINDLYPSADKADWIRDALARSFSNRGNARSRMGLFELALSDYNYAASLDQSANDPVLNKGVVLESLGRFDDAIDAYKRVLQSDPTDPAALNNMGNALMSKGEYSTAVSWFTDATRASPSFAFSTVNRSIALFASGDRLRALREVRAILRRNPSFPDARAALVAMLWSEGLIAEAESQYQRVDDPRYFDRAWLRQTRRWPEPLVQAMEAFLDVLPIGPQS